MTIRIDRRAEVVDELRAEIAELASSIVGLTVQVVDLNAFESARDAGKFRDFVDVAVVNHESEEVLEWVAEELVERFGWLVDVSRPQ